MTAERVMENLKVLVGRKFNNDDIICAFEDDEENGETEVIINKTSVLPMKTYTAYINAVDSKEFLIIVNGENIIVDVYEVKGVRSYEL